MKTRTFEIGPGVSCDVDRLISTRLLLQASSGAGKSWALRRLLEQTHGAVQQIVIDPEGEFSSLRERFDYILAARSGGDTAADPRTAKLLAARRSQRTPAPLMVTIQVRKCLGCGLEQTRTW